MPLVNNMEEVAIEIEKLGKAWHQFKDANEVRLKEIEAKGTPDPLITGKLEKLNTFMNATEDTIKKFSEKQAEMEAALARGLKNVGGDDENKSTPEQIEYRKAFLGFIRKGTGENLLPELGLKALSVNSDPDGGYVVTPEMSSTIIKVINEFSPIRALANVQTISTDSLEILTDTGTATSGWVSETGTRSNTDTPQIGKRDIPVHEMYAQPIATQKLLDDAKINIEQWLADKIAESFGIREATAFVSGNGVGQPRGFLTYASGTSWGQIQQVGSGSSGAVTADGLINLAYSLKEAYTKGASFLMKRATTAAVRLLKESTTNAYIWQPGLQLGQPATLLGFPAYEGVDMPTIAAASLSIAFANWKQAYQIVDRFGIRTLRDPYTSKPFVKFYTTKRVGGDVTNFEAIKLQVLS